MLDNLDESHEYSETNDLKILACVKEKMQDSDNVIFYTNDLTLKAIANIFGISAQEYEILEESSYDGYKVVELDDNGLNDFYSAPNDNYYDSLVNQYLLINATGEPDYGRYVWTGEGYAPLKYHKLFSKEFGEVRPIGDDPYQAFAVDSFFRNKITMVKGPAGSGKSYLSMAFLFHQLDAHRIDRIVIFCNTVATKNSARLGFYPGTKDEKLLDSQIGNMLKSKLGVANVQALIDANQLILLPMSDIRGYDTSGVPTGVYIPEAQNLDITLMKLALQRLGEDSICIIDGDDESQVDMACYEGHQNGMKRVSQVFRGEDIYGEVRLSNIHRSKIAQIADRM